MTYRQLLQYLLQLSQKQLDGDVSYRICAGEYYAVRGIDDGTNIGREFDILEVYQDTTNASRPIPVYDD